ncbi:MAG: AbrB/MazE/SpoVT family DNA-binding domain-containing protein [Deltaproteobacteria bacterium]|nr:AbrB/MazE/SpoVT family DNA-binding domain-containing protein [Deltaproteobacteria bacterium]
MNLKTIVSEKGQITIPKALRKRLGIHTGQVLRLSEESGKLVAVKESARDPIDDVYGIIKTGKSSNQMIRMLRGDDK